MSASKFVSLLVVATATFAASLAMAQDGIISEDEKTITMELSNDLISVSECVVADDYNYLNGNHFYTADFAITRFVKSKVWVKDANGAAIPGTETLVERTITTTFNKDNSLEIGDCVTKGTCTSGAEKEVKRTCNAYREMYLSHLAATEPKKKK